MKYAKIENGKVRVYSTLPRHFENITNFRYQDIDTINSKDFFEVVIPNITEYQILEPLIVSDKVNTQFIQRFRDFTQEEIDNYDQNQLDSDDSSQWLQNRKERGNQIYTRVDAFAKRNYTKPKTISIQEFFYDAVDPLLNGKMELARKRINALPTPLPDNAHEAVKTKYIDKIVNFLDNE